MANVVSAKLKITVSLGERTLTLLEVVGSLTTTLLVADVVSGCDEAGTPAGEYKAGKWIKDKTNPIHGPQPWSQHPWQNPYGPYFLPLNDSKTGKYTTYGIHGTRGPLVGNFEKPPLPESLIRFFVGNESAKYLYCSHGCIRVSNKNVTKMFDLTTKAKYAGIGVSVSIQ